MYRIMAWKFLSPATHAALGGPNRPPKRTVSHVIGSDKDGHTEWRPWGMCPKGT